MSERESHRAGREARLEVEAHPERASRHEEWLGRYLQGVAYHDAEHEHRAATRSGRPHLTPDEEGGRGARRKRSGNADRGHDAQAET